MGGGRFSNPFFVIPTPQRCRLRCEKTHFLPNRNLVKWGKNAIFADEKKNAYAGMEMQNLMM